MASKRKKSDESEEVADVGEDKNELKSKKRKSKNSEVSLSTKREEEHEQSSSKVKTKSSSPDEPKRNTRKEESQPKRAKRDDSEQDTPQSEKKHKAEVPEEKDEKKVFTAYLTGFPYDTNIEEFVRGIVSGVTDVRVHVWHDTGRSRGCAHVDFRSQSDLNAAITKLDRQTVGSRYVNAVEANSKSQANLAPPSKEDDSRGGRRLFVKNLPYDIDEARVKEFFSTFGAVKHVRIPQWNHTDNKKGFGYVEFEQKAFAIKCVQTHRAEGLSMSGRQLTLDYDQGKPKRGFKDEHGRAWYKPKEGVATKRS
jgi:RNA recognition motif-containing protein